MSDLEFSLSYDSDDGSTRMYVPLQVYLDNLKFVGFNSKSAKATAETSIATVIDGEVDKEMIPPDKTRMKEMMQKVGHNKVVVKIVKWDLVEESSYSEDDLRRELMVLFKVGSNPNVAAFYGMYPDPQNCVSYVFSERAQGVSVTSFMALTDYDEEMARVIFMQIASAVSHVHNARVLHRDLAPSCIFVNENAQVKVADFGISAKLTNLQESMMHHGTNCVYLAPEIIRSRMFESVASDVYSMGVILYEMLTGEVPYTGIKSKIFVQIFNRNMSFPDNLSKEVTSMIREMLHPLPKMRPTVEDCENNDWTLGVIPSPPTEITEITDVIADPDPKAPSEVVEVKVSCQDEKFKFHHLLPDKNVNSGQLEYIKMVKPLLPMASTNLEIPKRDAMKQKAATLSVPRHTLKPVRGFKNWKNPFSKRPKDTGKAMKEVLQISSITKPNYVVEQQILVTDQETVYSSISAGTSSVSVCVYDYADTESVDSQELKEMKAEGTYGAYKKVLKRFSRKAEKVRKAIMKEQEEQAASGGTAKKVNETETLQEDIADKPSKNIPKPEECSANNPTKKTPKANNPTEKTKKTEEGSVNNPTEKTAKIEDHIAVEPRNKTTILGESNAPNPGGETPDLDEEIPLKPSKKTFKLDEDNTTKSRDNTPKLTTNPRKGTPTVFGPRKLSIFGKDPVANTLKSGKDSFVQLRKYTPELDEEIPLKSSKKIFKLDEDSVKSQENTQKVDKNPRKGTPTAFGPSKIPIFGKGRAATPRENTSKSIENENEKPREESIENKEDLRFKLSKKTLNPKEDCVKSRENFPKQTRNPRKGTPTAFGPCKIPIFGKGRAVKPRENTPNREMSEKLKKPKEHVKKMKSTPSEHALDSEPASPVSSLTLTAALVKCEDISIGRKADNVIQQALKERAMKPTCSRNLKSAEAEIEEWREQSDWHSYHRNCLSEAGDMDIYMKSMDLDKYAKTFKKMPSMPNKHLGKKMRPTSIEHDLDSEPASSESSLTLTSALQISKEEYKDFHIKANTTGALLRKKIKTVSAPTVLINDFKPRVYSPDSRRTASPQSVPTCMSDYATTDVMATPRSLGTPSYERDASPDLFTLKQCEYIRNGRKADNVIQQALKERAMEPICGRNLKSADAEIEEWREQSDWHSYHRNCVSEAGDMDEYMKSMDLDKYAKTFKKTLTRKTQLVDRVEEKLEEILLRRKNKQKALIGSISTVSSYTEVPEYGSVSSLQSANRLELRVNVTKKKKAPSKEYLPVEQCVTLPPRDKHEAVMEYVASLLDPSNMTPVPEDPSLTSALPASNAQDCKQMKKATKKETKVKKEASFPVVTGTTIKLAETKGHPNAKRAKTLEIKQTCSKQEAKGGTMSPEKKTPPSVSQKQKTVSPNKETPQTTKKDYRGKTKPPEKREIPTMVNQKQKEVSPTKETLQLTKKDSHDETKSPEKKTPSIVNKKQTVMSPIQETLQSTKKDNKVVPQSPEKKTPMVNQNQKEMSLNTGALQITKKDCEGETKSITKKKLPSTVNQKEKELSPDKERQQITKRNSKVETESPALKQKQTEMSPGVDTLMINDNDCEGETETPEKKTPRIGNQKQKQMYAHKEALQVTKFDVMTGRLYHTNKPNYRPGSHIKKEVSKRAPADSKKVTSARMKTTNGRKSVLPPLTSIQVLGRDSLGQPTLRVQATQSSPQIKMIKSLDKAILPPIKTQSIYPVERVRTPKVKLQKAPAEVQPTKNQTEAAAKPDPKQKTQHKATPLCMRGQSKIPRARTRAETAKVKDNKPSTELSKMQSNLIPIMVHVTQVKAELKSKAKMTVSKIPVSPNHKLYRRQSESKLAEVEDDAEVYVLKAKPKLSTIRAQPKPCGNEIESVVPMVDDCVSVPVIRSKSRIPRISKIQVKPVRACSSACTTVTF